jgi:transcriptional regulator with XRE-family HTH domain
MGLRQIFIDNMKRLRADCGISQMALAERVDSSTNYISEIEIGRKFPSVEMIERIAAAFSVEAYQLFRADTEVDTTEQSAEDYLRGVPLKIRKELAVRLSSRIAADIDKTFLPD